MESTNCLSASPRQLQAERANLLLRLRYLESILSRLEAQLELQASAKCNNSISPTPLTMN